jgi:hypothetical protein
MIYFKAIMNHNYYIKSRQIKYELEVFNLKFELEIAIQIHNYCFSLPHPRL